MADNDNVKKSVDDYLEQVKDQTVVPGKWFPSTMYIASQFRSLGLKLPDEIPDCAVIPQFSCHVSLEFVPMTDEQVKNGELRFDWVYQFTRPFTWVDATVTIDKPISE